MIDDCILPLLGVEFWRGGVGGGTRGRVKGEGAWDDLSRMKSMQM